MFSFILSFSNQNIRPFCSRKLFKANYKKKKRKNWEIKKTYRSWHEESRVRDWIRFRLHLTVRNLCSDLCSMTLSAFQDIQSIKMYKMWCRSTKRLLEQTIGNLSLDMWQPHIKLLALRYMVSQWPPTAKERL